MSGNSLKHYYTAYDPSASKTVFFIEIGKKSNISYAKVVEIK